MPVILIGTSGEAYTPKQKRGYREVMDVWTSSMPLAPIAETMASVMIGGTDADRQPWLDKWLDTDRKRLRAAADCLINCESTTELLSEIECPVILLRGVGDQAFSAENMEELARGLGVPAQLHAIAGATAG